MRKLSLGGLVVGLLLLMPAAARAQLNAIQPQEFTGGFFSHPGFDEGGWYAGFDFMYLQKLIGNYSGLAPDSILNIGYRFEDGTVLQFNWWDQFVTPNPGAPEKFQIFDLMWRFPTYDNGCFRQWGTWGPRFILESQDFVFPGPITYDVDNNMIGGYIGCMNEWYLGTNPLGAWSFTLDGDIGAYANFVRGAAGANGGSNSASTFTLSGSLQGRAGLIWYVSEGITINVGVEALTIINIQQPNNPSVQGNSINASLIPTMPIWLGVYLGFGFVF